MKDLDFANYRTEYTCGTCKCPRKEKWLFCLTICLHDPCVKLCRFPSTYAVLCEVLKTDLT